MDESTARRQLADAVAELAAFKDAQKHLADVIRDVAPVLPQVEIVRATGYTRENVRLIVRNERSPSASR